MAWAVPIRSDQARVGASNITGVPGTACSIRSLSALSTSGITAVPAFRPSRPRSSDLALAQVLDGYLVVYREHRGQVGHVDPFGLRSALAGQHAHRVEQDRADPSDAGEPVEHAVGVTEVDGPAERPAGVVGAAADRIEVGVQGLLSALFQDGAVGWQQG